MSRFSTHQNKTVKGFFECRQMAQNEPSRSGLKACINKGNGTNETVERERWLIKSLIGYVVPEGNKAECFLFRRSINLNDIKK